MATAGGPVPTYVDDADAAVEEVAARRVGVLRLPPALGALRPAPPSPPHRDLLGSVQDGRGRVQRSVLATCESNARAGVCDSSQNLRRRRSLVER